jgi:ABC-type polysaccharide/polyol phosphate transport system ATPase subunit
MTRAEIEARMDAIVAFSELGEFIDVPVKTYSSGMFVRLGFAIAAHLAADVMLIDEVLAVGDEAFQRKCETRIAERVQEGATLVLVSHDAALVERTCERVVVLDAGAVSFDGPAADGMAHYHEMMGTVTA